MNHFITERTIDAFKTHFCNENKIITSILKEKASAYFINPILDVGSGPGDILSISFPEKAVVHLDSLDFGAALPPSHVRVQGSFFTFVPTLKVNTVFLCHVLQYLDENVVRLNEVIRKLSPEYLVTVTNCNDDFLGELLIWFKEFFPSANPEVALQDFPLGFKKECEFPFKAQLACPTFEILAEQIFYLFEVENTRKNNECLVKFLKKRLSEPAFSIHQVIRVYRRNDK